MIPSPTPATIAIRTQGGFEIVVPATLDVMTTYVLLEQEDWFEDEIHFVRRAVSEGACGIDIGANFGVYTLSLARAVGPEGRVFAFEPSRSTCAHLRDSVQRNGFDQVEIIETALSDQVGTGILHGERAELRALAVAGGDQDGERVALTTLDAWAASARPGPVDFIKIDAEGHERAIIAGGSDFFQTQDPLVMMEVRKGSVIDLSVATALEAHGYEAYCLVPALGVLVPFKRLMIDGGTRPDPWLLNVFFCKTTRRDALAAKGLLVATWTAIDEPAPELWSDSWRTRPAYAAATAAFAPGARRTDSVLYRRALAHALAAADSSLDIVTRLRHLDGACRWLGTVPVRTATAARLSTICRVCADFGWRHYAVTALAALKTQMRSGRGVLDEPFLAPVARYDFLPVRNVSDWFSSSVAEAHIRMSQYSAYFVANESTTWLDYLKATGFLTPELERRRQLIRLRQGLQPKLESSPLLTAPAADHLNPALWHEDGLRRWAPRR